MSGSAVRKCIQTRCASKSAEIPEKNSDLQEWSRVNCKPCFDEHSHDPNAIAFLPDSMTMNGLLRKRHTGQVTETPGTCPCMSPDSSKSKAEQDIACVMHYKESVQAVDAIIDGEESKSGGGEESKSGGGEQRSSFLSLDRTRLIESGMRDDTSKLFHQNETQKRYLAAKTRLQCNNPHHVPGDSLKAIHFPTIQARTRHGKALGELAHKCQECEKPVGDQQQEIGLHFAEHHPDGLMRYCQFCDGYYSLNQHDNNRNHDDRDTNNDAHNAGRQAIRRFSTRTTKTPNPTTKNKFGLVHATKYNRKTLEKNGLPDFCRTCGYSTGTKDEHTSHVYCYEHHHLLPVGSRCSAVTTDRIGEVPEDRAQYIIDNTNDLKQCPVCLQVDVNEHSSHRLCRNGDLRPPRNSMYLEDDGLCETERVVFTEKGLQYCPTCHFPSYNGTEHKEHVLCDGTNMVPQHHRSLVGRNCVAIPPK